MKLKELDFTEIDIVAPSLVDLAGTEFRRALTEADDKIEALVYFGWIKG